MANRQTYVIGALGVLVGMVVGAQSAQRADVVSFAGHNPNSEIIRDMPNLRRAAGIWRQRSEEEALGGSVFYGQTYRLTPNRNPSISQNVAARRAVRQSQNRTHYSAAPTQTIRGVPAPMQLWDPTCGDLTTKRGQTCNYYRQQGFDYELNYFPAY